MAMINARWNGEPAWARKVVVIVGKPMRPTWWCANLEGHRRNAVEVIYDGSTFYLDNDATCDRPGWDKVTIGMGSPSVGSYSLPDDSVVVDVIWEPEGYPQ